MAKTNKLKFTSRDVAIVNALKENPDGLTLNEIATAIGMEVKSGHLVSLMSEAKGVITVIGEKDVARKANRKVTVYHFVTADVLKDAKGKNCNYTDNEKALMKVASEMETDFTLADLAVALGKEKLSSGSINGLIKKGNIVKTDEMRSVEATTKASVNVYGFVKDIPEGALIEDVVGAAK